MTKFWIFTLSLILSSAAYAKDLKVDVKEISEEGVGEKIGEIVISEGSKGVMFKVAITGLPQGEHGFHVHENGACGPGMILKIRNPIRVLTVTATRGIHPSLARRLTA